VPAGSSSGRKIRLKGKGFPSKDGPGDLFAELQVAVPHPLSDQERELFEKLKEASAFKPRE
jgi:curved DNA-binding protein